MLRGEDRWDKARARLPPRNEIAPAWVRSESPTFGTRSGGVRPAGSPFADVGIRPALDADFRRGAVAGEDGDVVAEREDLFADAGEE